MGQSHSTKQKIAPRPHRLAPSISPPQPLQSSHPFTTSAPVQRVSRPDPQRAITRMSELIDPNELIAYEAQMNGTPFNPSQPSRPPRPPIESPSGSLLSVAEFCNHRGRMPTVTERKQAIQKRTRQKIDAREQAVQRGERQKIDEPEQAIQTGRRRKIFMGTVPEADPEAEVGVGLSVRHVEHQDGEKEGLISRMKCLRTCCCGFGGWRRRSEMCG